MGRVSGIKTAADIVMLFLLFRLVGCNIVLMKRFLPLFILTGLLFGQDIKYDPDTGEPIMPQEVKYDPDTGEPIMPQVYSAKGQDVLYLKSGESYGGTFIRKVDKDIVFKVEGEKRSTNFPINDVYGIETKYYGELYYPFDVPSEKEIYKQERQAPDDILNRLSDGWNSLSFKYKIYCLYFLLMAWMSLTSPY